MVAKATLTEVISKLSTSEGLSHQHSPSVNLRGRRSIRTSSTASSSSTSADQQQQQWPDEIEISIEGFFDSEKETNWVSVEVKKYFD